MKFICGLIIILITSLAHADTIYQYQDKNGVTVFTNKPVKNAKPVKLPPLGILPSPQTKSIANFKNYPAYNHNAREAILTEELKKERENLQKTKTRLQKLTAAPKNTQDPEQIKYLQTSILEHQKNIEILNNQLAN